jgi:hypothetical protein
MVAQLIEIKKLIENVQCKVLAKCYYLVYYFFEIT